MDKKVTDYKLILPPEEIEDIHNKACSVDILDPTAYLDKLLTYLDCTRVTASGNRIVQTIDHMYKHDVTAFLYVLGLVTDKGVKKEYRKKLDELHKKNIEFEIENPPKLYVKKTKSRTKSTKEPKENKPSKKALKAASKVAKINMLKINLKPKQ